MFCGWIMNETIPCMLLLLVNLFHCRVSKTSWQDAWWVIKGTPTADARQNGTFSLCCKTVSLETYYQINIDPRTFQQGLLNI